MIRPGAGARRYGRWTGWLALAAVVVAFYAWTAATSERPNDPVGVYNRLADAFAHGQLNLRLATPPGLRHLHDLNDYQQKAPYLHVPYGDLALSDGRLYAYWGPVPALLVFLPARLAGADSVSERWVTFAFCLGVLAFSLALLLEVLRRWAPRTPPWYAPVAFVVLAAAGGELWLLRKPDVYQLAIAAGVCLLLAGLFALLRGVGPERVRLRLLALGSLAIGLAFGSRWSVAPALLVPVALLAWLWRRTEIPKARLIAALLAPMGVCVALLAAYNWARFGSPFETGLRRILVGFDVSSFKLLRAPSARGFAYYVLEPFLVRPQFPYLWTNPPDPHRYIYSEPSAGLLWTTPILLAIPLAWAALRRSRPLLFAVAALAGLGLVIFAPYVLYRFVAVRYFADFTVLFLLAALIAVAAVLSGLRSSRRARRGLVWVVALVAGFSVAVNGLLSLDGLASSRPKTLASLSSTFSWIPQTAANVAGHSLLVGIDGGPALPRREPVKLTYQQPRVAVDVVAPGPRPVGLRLRLTHVSGLGPQDLVVRVQSPVELSPPAFVSDQVASVPVRVHGGVNRLWVVLLVNKPVSYEARYALVDVLGVDDAKR